uniref:Uncharacterized protein n=1 Tax=Arundo donax TaxID=35708 RepID=A0A0A9HLS1_ARUDO
MLLVSNSLSNYVQITYLRFLKLSENPAPCDYYLPLYEKKFSR